MKPINSLTNIYDKYDVILLDLWGVVHDGLELYPGVQDTLIQLKKAGKKVIMLSNAPRRSEKVKARLKELGIDKTLYDEVVTSGEVGVRWLAEGKAKWGKNYYYLGDEKDADVINGMDYQRASSPENADFLLNVGFGANNTQLSESLPVLKDCKKNNLPMLCLNPDLEVVKMNGDRHPCAGALAREYEKMGGAVEWFGKPYSNVYERCVELLGSVSKDRMLMVGDSLETDIPGAKKFGIDSILITGGLLKNETLQKITALCAEKNLDPTYVIPGFQWEVTSGLAR